MVRLHFQHFFDKKHQKNGKPMGKKYDSESNPIFSEFLSVFLNFQLIEMIEVPQQNVGVLLF